MSSRLRTAPDPGTCARCRVAVREPGEDRHGSAEEDPAGDVGSMIGRVVLRCERQQHSAVRGYQRHERGVRGTAQHFGYKYDYSNRKLDDSARIGWSRAVFCCFTAMPVRSGAMASPNGVQTLGTARSSHVSVGFRSPSERSLSRHTRSRPDPPNERRQLHRQCRSAADAPAALAPGSWRLQPAILSRRQLREVVIWRASTEHATQGVTRHGQAAVKGRQSRLRPS